MAGNNKAALIVVDMQEDFCPPNGTLAVNEGRAIAPIINTLLANPGFTIRIVTQDYHPPNHISFATNHPPPNNIPFQSCITMRNPSRNPAASGSATEKENQKETKPQQLWPAHCVAGTSGASLIPELDARPIDLYVKKGMNAQVEMYSAFADAFGNLDASSAIEEDGFGRAVDVDVKAALRERGVRDVFVVGLAGDYCVRYTAIDAVKAGFRVFVVEEGVRCVVPGGWGGTRRELARMGVCFVSVDGPEVAGIGSCG